MNRETLYPLVLNNNSLVVGSVGNSTYRYTFPAGSVRFENSKVAIANIAMYYSWFNITASQGNNSFSVIWPTGAGSTTYVITLPDGFYSITTLNQYIQQYCITNNLYLINTAGNYVYYFEFQESSTYYGVQFNAYPVPTALPAGWTAPAGFPAYPVATLTPQLIVPATNFRNIIGYNAGTYPIPAQATTYSKLSDFTPQVSPVQSIIVSCSLVNNKYANPSTILHTFAISDVSFGSTIEVKPSEYSFIDVQDGNYPYFDIQFLDQSFTPLQIRDTNLIVELLIKTGTNKGVSY